MNTTMASYANLSLYSAMGVLALSMLAYILYLASLAPARADRLAEQEVPDLVTAGGATAAGAAAGADSRADAVGGPVVAAGADSRADAVVTPAVRTSDAPSGEASVRGQKAAAIGYNLAWLTTLLLAVSVALRGLSVTRTPLGNMFEFAVAGALVVMLGFCVWSLKRDLRWMGAFVTLPVLLVLGAALTVWYTEASELLPALKSYWLVIHVTIAVIAISMFFFGFVVLVLHLLQARREQSGRQDWLSRLPGAVALERLSYSIHIVAFPLWTFSIMAGAIWARQAWGSYWNWDPKETWSFVIWAIYAAYLHARATKNISRDTATWIAIAGFIAIIVNYVIVNQFFVGQHSYSGL